MTLIKGILLFFLLPIVMVKTTVVTAWEKGPQDTTFVPIRRTVDLDDPPSDQIYACNLDGEKNTPTTWKDGKNPKLQLRKVIKTPKEKYVQLLIDYDGSTFPVATYLTIHHHKVVQIEYSIKDVIASETRIYINPTSTIQSLQLGVQHSGFFKDQAKGWTTHGSQDVKLEYNTNDETVTITQGKIEAGAEKFDFDKAKRIEEVCGETIYSIKDVFIH